MIHSVPSTTNMKRCSPGGSGTTADQMSADDRVSACAEVDHPLKLPATTTLVAAARLTTKRTPSGVAVGGAGTTRAAQEALATAVIAAIANAHARGRHTGVGDYSRRLRPASSRHSVSLIPARLVTSRVVGSLTSSTAFRDPNPSSVCSGANGSAIHCALSTTNMYS